MNFDNRTLFIADNLDIMRGMDSKNDLLRKQSSETQHTPKGVRYTKNQKSASIRLIRENPVILTIKSCKSPNP